MAIRVLHVATGNVGRIALSQLIEDPRFELAGLVVSSPEKVGRDAGELAGLGVVTGVAATADLDAALAARPECTSYCAIGEVRLFDALGDIQRILASGSNVVASSPVPLIYPWGVLPDRMIEPVEDACRAGKTSLFATGVDPGWVNDLLPFAIASTCQRVEQVRCSEIADYATYDGGPVMFDFMGFGRPPGDLPKMFKPGMLAASWGVSLRMLARGFGFELDDITEWYELEPAPEAFDVAAGHVPAGGIAGMRFQIRGVAGGREVLVIDHTTRLRGDLRPDWPQPAQDGGSYRVEIVGEPSYRVDVCPTSARGDHNYAAIAAGAGRIVNAIPDVVAAPPGLRTPLDLPFNTARGVFAAALSD
ncbi:NAD(P)H-dependent amine dehydrogenase family protein [Actinomadura madurae]|uniref:NAD(P)H-dependent amine dehydrogenase family protein n=1 Tax=Actinomadura madurae TaxID=1993 RepID=UPI0020263300|nr:dihydrodipicolinate reductase [Actinomadura madurae]MCQ0010841.1 dihydrodipicolinate reductase [Actinomadura madurae]MCQ0013850.1 dihydrodipicolinate reductase [Actinomadura madurae]URM94046.1 dihydrodipicolinate reductase [Actinomadura madurae]URN04752.1 dihydrodipicolinate reductase [Actinomadura madurae]